MDNLQLPRLSVLAAEGIALGGLDWYREAEVLVDVLALESQSTPETAAAVLALTSPRQPVARNVFLTREWLQGRLDEKVLLPSIRLSLDHWQRTGKLRGPKTEAFRRALLGDPDAVVLDVHMLAAMGQGPKPTPRQYRKLAGTLRGLATKAGVSARDYQAAVWTGVRARKGYPVATMGTFLLA